MRLSRLISPLLELRRYFFMPFQSWALLFLQESYFGIISFLMAREGCMRRNKECLASNRYLMRWSSYTNNRTFRLPGNVATTIDSIV